MKKIWTAVFYLLFLATPAHADTLYQANVGGYSVGGGLSVGIGFGAGPYGGYADSNTITYGNSYSVTSGIPYEGSNYPYGQSCCRGCNQCNNCSNGYGSSCR